MNVERFIAHRLLRGDGKGSVAVPIVKIAVAGIALGLCVMLLSLFVMTGFKKEITDKLSGFVSHLNVVPYASGNDYGEMCVAGADSLAEAFRRLEGVADVHVYVDKPAILKSETEIHGVVMKGVDSTYGGDFFRQHLKEGRMPDFSGPRVSNEVLISESVAGVLGVGVGDRLTAHFVQEPPRARRLTVAGIYATGFKEYDDVAVLVDIRHLSRLNGWQAGEASGVAIDVNDLRRLEECRERVYDKLAERGETYLVKSLRDEAPQIFDWLALLNMNVWVILVLIVTVAGFNMVSGLLVLILDKTSLIGILKALGCKDVSLRRLFLYVAGELMARGMVWGNVVGLGLCLAQRLTGFLTLDAATYYMDRVPVVINGWYVLLLNIGTLVASVLMLVGPSCLIARIRPADSMRYE